MSAKQTDKQNLQKPLVSFIITCYNIPIDMLKKCIESILALSLTESEREIILIDDGSFESPLNGLSDCLKHVLYVRQENSGLSSARNTGIRISTGEYVQFIDGDDALIETPYNHCLDIVRFQHPDIVLFGLSDSNDYVNEPKTEEIVSGIEYMRHNNLNASACGYVFRKTVMGNLRFTPGIIHEDEEFTPQLMLRAERVLKTNVKAYYYRKRSNSITGNKGIRQIIKRLNDKESIIFKLQTMAATMPDADRLALNRRVHQVTMDYIYDVISQTRSEHYTERRINRLKRKGLFPLPDNDYTKKYKLFRIMSKNKLMRKLLYRTIIRFGR